MASCHNYNPFTFTSFALTFRNEPLRGSRAKNDSDNVLNRVYKEQPITVIDDECVYVRN